MTEDRRHRDTNWLLAPCVDGTVPYDSATIAVLMDIRDRLDVLRCSNFQAIPGKLDAIVRQTRRVRERRVPALTRHKLAMRHVRAHARRQAR